MDMANLLDVAATLERLAHIYRRELPDYELALLHDCADLVRTFCV